MRASSIPKLRVIIWLEFQSWLNICPLLNKNPLHFFSDCFFFQSKYSFRKELGSGTYTLEDVITIAKNLKYVKGFELLDNHIPGFKSEDTEKSVVDAGIKKFKKLAEDADMEVYALGPHTKLYQEKVNLDSEVEKFKKWIDLCADNGIPNMRTQIQGPWGFKLKRNFKPVMDACVYILDRVLPYAVEKKVMIR